MKKQRRSKNKAFSDDQFTGPVLTLIVLLLIVPLNHILPFAELSPVPFFLTLVAYSAFAGSTRSALVSSFIGIAYSVHFYWLFGDITALWDGDDFYTVAQLGLAALAISLLVGRLKEKTIRPYRSALSRSEGALRLKTVALMKSNADLENFLHMASPDLKSPMVNLEALMAILRDEVGANPGSEISSVLRQMEKTMFSMHQTLHMVQAHMRTNSQVNEQTECNLQELVDEIKDSISLLIAESGAQINTEFSSVPQIVFIRGKLYSVLYNLITNAIKYRHQSRHPDVRISAFAAGEYFVLEVTDNGLGIDLEKEGENLFRIFKRVHQHVEGSGVGLYLVKQIAESTGGYVDVTSKPGTGSTFKVFLRPAKIRKISDAGAAEEKAIAV